MKEKQIQKYRELVEFLPEIEKKKILDVGCGPRWVEEFLKENNKINYIGIDTDYSPNIKASGDFLPFKNKTFDIVFCIDTLHLLEEKKELKRVLKNKGYLIISEPESLFKKEKLKKFKDLKLINKRIIGREEKDILLVFMGP